MRKRIAIAILLSVLILWGSFSVSALTPGYSDYRIMTSVRLNTVDGDSVELTNLETSAFIKFNKQSLPNGIEAVSFDAKKLDAVNPRYIAMEAAAKSLKLQKLSMFDFSLTDIDKNSKIIDLNQPVAITVACDTGVNSVYFYNDTTNKLEYIGGELSENKRYITFDISHFSYFVLAFTEKTADTPAPVFYTTNETNKNDTAITLLICTAVLALGCEILITLKRIFKIN